MMMGIYQLIKAIVIFKIIILLIFLIINSNYNKICASSIIKPTKKIVNKTLSDRDKILDSIHINKFNYEKLFLNKYKQKQSNTLWKIPLEMRKKIKNKLLNNPICLIKNKKSSYSLDKNARAVKL